MLMKKKDIQENTFGGIVKLRQDIDNSTYQLFQRLEKSPNGEVIDTFINGNKKIEIEISYTKTKDKKVSRTTADTEILLAALLTQNNFDNTITNITLKDLLFYLNKEYSKQNYERLKMDLKILKTMNRNIIAEEIDEINEGKAPKKYKMKMQSIVIDDLQLDSRSRKENYIKLSDSFVSRVKEKFIIHLPPKEVFFALNSNEKNVCERLIAILRPRGHGAERKFGLSVLKKSLDDFTTEILGHKYKYTHKKKEVIKIVLHNLNFLVKDFDFQKEKARRKIYVVLWFYTYEEYIQNVDKLRKESKYYEDLGLFPKEELQKMERDKPQIFYDLKTEGVSEAKINSILEKEFNSLKENKEAIIQAYEDRGLTFLDYVKAKFYIAKLYSDREVRKGNPVSFEAIFVKAIQYNWENKKLEETEKREKAVDARKEKEKKLKELEKKKAAIYDKWSKIIDPAINEIISKNPSLIDEIITELKKENQFYLSTYDNSKTGLENYKNKMFIRVAVDSKITERYKKIKKLADERDKETEAVKKEMDSL